MKRIKLTDWISFNRVRGKRQVCSYCKEPMERGEHGLIIRQDNRLHPRNTSNGSQYNIWIHLNCVEDFIRTIKEGFEENKSKLVMESL